MLTPIQVTFRHIDRSIALEHRARELINKLERYCDRITGCHVVIEGPASHANRDQGIHVYLELAVPGGTINTSNAPKKHAQHCDANVALRDAFEAAERQLTNFATAE
jgi:ribosome-associated translation inhibitor RaiA